MITPQNDRVKGVAPLRTYVAVAVVAGAVFAVIALLHVPGIWYAIVAVLVGLAYTSLRVWRRNNGRNRNRNRNRTRRGR